MAVDLQKKAAVLGSVGKKGIVTLMQDVLYKVSTVLSATRCGTLPIVHLPNFSL